MSAITPVKPLSKSESNDKYQCKNHAETQKLYILASTREQLNISKSILPAPNISRME